MSDKQQIALDAINNFYKNNGYFPTAKDITKELKCSRAMTYKYIIALEKLGLLTRNKNKYGRIISTSSFPLLTHESRNRKKKR